VRGLRGVGAVLALAWALRPEIGRYQSERILRATQATLRFIAAHPTDVADPMEALARVETFTGLAASRLPQDPRPWILKGGAQLVRGRPDEAVASYRRANALGERAETDLNLGRAFEAQGDEARSHAAFLRAVWISPSLLSALLPDTAARLFPELQRLERDLRAGRLRAPPPPAD